MLEAPTIIAGLDDVAMVGEPVEHVVAILGSPNTPGHSRNVKLVVMIT